MTSTPVRLSPRWLVADMTACMVAASLEDLQGLYMQVFHYDTAGPVAYRLDWGNISFCYSGKALPREAASWGAQKLDQQKQGALPWTISDMHPAAMQATPFRCRALWTWPKAATWYGHSLLPISGRCIVRAEM